MTNACHLGRPMLRPVLFSAILFCLTATGMFTPLAAGGATGDDLAAGRRLLAQRKYVQAYDRLFAAFLRSPDDPTVNFLLGRAAFEKGDYERAVMAFDRVLIVHPEAMRVKLELARCYLALESYGPARHYLEEVLAGRPPAAVAANIQVLLDSINQQEKRHFLYGSLALGYSHDDNARIAPNDDTVRIYLGNTAFNTTISDRPGDNIWAATLTVDHLYRPPEGRVSWKTSFFHYLAGYQFEDDLDTRYLGLATGPSFQVGEAVIDLQPQITQLELGHDRYLRAAGVSGRYTRPLGANVLLQLGVQGEDKRYFADSDRDRDAFTTTFTFDETFSLGRTRLDFGVSAELENAEKKWFDYDRYNIDLRLEHLFPRQLRLWASGHRHTTNYDEDDPRFRITRSDKVWTFGAGARKTLWQQRQRRLDLEVSYSFTNANSNVALYTYDKDVVNTTLNLAF